VLDFSRFEAMTFDCYGTLIDWERGILEVVRPLGARAANPPTDAQVLAAYGELEAAAERGPYRRYREVLGAVLAGLAERFGFPLAPGEHGRLAESVRDWPAFADTPAALAALKRRYRLCICSNVDRELFALTAPKLGVEFDAVVTAEDVGSYKPAPGHWRRAMEVLGLPASKILHVAQSLFHDVAPARELGFATVWVNRRGGTIGVGVEARADVEAVDLAMLAALANR